jgi:acetyltransferase
MDATTPNPHCGTSGRNASPVTQLRRHPLDRIFAPRSIAILGASETPCSVGRAVVENLQCFEGPIYFVNPNHQEVFGAATFSSVQDVMAPIDLAVIAVPAGAVVETIRQCAAVRVGGAVILSAGFKERGRAGAALEQEVLAEARKANLRIVGPNCLGVMIPHGKLNATFAATMGRPGSVAFLSQSGALCTAVLDWSLSENVGFSAFVSVGSMLDVGWGDLITYFGDDPHTMSIVCYMESIGDARNFLSAAREVALTKPIIVLKVGRTKAGTKAAVSHTGSLTGSDAVVDTALRRVGALRVANIEELFDMAKVLGKQPRPRGPRLAIVTNAGGPGALAADALVMGGGKIAELSSDSIESLNALLPNYWSHGNPIDLLGDATPERYGQAIEVALHDPATDGVLVVLTPQAMTDAVATAERLRAMARTVEKPILASWMGGSTVHYSEAILNDAGIPTFKYPDRAARAFELMWRHTENLRSLYETPTLCSPFAPCDVNRTDRVRTLLGKARLAQRTLLTEVESKEILSAYGIPCIETHVAFTEDEAVRHAEQLGFPVVLKLFSETLTHKSDMGGVQLNLCDAAAVRRAWKSIHDSVAEKAGKQHFLGVTVQPMIFSDGYELILGSSVDSQFGPVLLFGAGGQLTEIFKDTALSLPPLNTTLARQVIKQTQIHSALCGVRGRPAIDLDALTAVLVRFSQLVAEQLWIAEIDINPLLVSADRIVALDARVVLHGDVTEERELPKLAIRPYPTQYVRPVQLKDSTLVVIRPIRPEDESLMVEFHRGLSDRSVYHRYFSPLKLEQRITHERLSRICFVDYDREMALVAEKSDAANGQRVILGVGRLSKLHGTDEAEFALLIADEWQGRGLGTELLASLVRVAREEGWHRLSARILPDNHSMQSVARRTGFSLHTDSDTHESYAELNL